MLGTRPSVPSFLRVPPAVLPLPELRVPKTRTRIKSSITRRPGDCFDAREITKESKSSHFRRLKEKYLCDYEDMLFFDNEYGNAASEFDVRVLRAFRRTDEPHIDTARPTTTWDVAVPRRCFLCVMY